MELHIINNKRKEFVVLLDEKMRIVKPVFEYLNFLEIKESALNTLIANGRDLKLYWDFLNIKHYAYDSIKPLMIGEFIDFLKHPMKRSSNKLISVETRSNITINRILSSVHGFYKFYEIKHGLNNPMVTELSKRPTFMFKEMLYHIKKDTRIHRSVFKLKEKQEAFKLITDKEAKIIEKVLTSYRNKLIFKVLYLTGARIGEVLGLQITDIPYPDTSIAVGVLKNIKSKGKYRDLFMPMSLIEELDSYIINERSKIETESTYIFVSLKPPFVGKPLSYNAIYQAFCQVKEQTGLNFNIHDCRHSFVTFLVESGMDMSVVQLIVGHAYVATTEKYTHLSVKYLEKSLGEYWNKSALVGGGRNV